MAATPASDSTDGPVMSLINKRLRALRKKHNRIIQMEESIAQGKTINKEQEEVLRSKPAITVLIEELEKLRSPLSTAVSEEISLAIQKHQVSSDQTTVPDKGSDDNAGSQETDDSKVEDLVKLLYFGSLFDVKSQSEFTSTMLTRTHERGCCLTYDYVTDDATDLLGERDLDLISMLGGLVISRPADSSLSHKDALQQCIERAKLWLSNSDEPFDENAGVSYSALGEKLKKIMASDYFTTTPEMKAPVEMAAAAGNYAPFQAAVQGSAVPAGAPVQVEASAEHYHQKPEDEAANFQEQETLDNSSTPTEENHQNGEVAQAPGEISENHEQFGHYQVEEQEYNSKELEHKEQQYIPRRPYFNQRGGRGGRRGYYSNGRGGRGRGGGGGYQNGRNQYFDQPGNYYQRSYYNNRGRGGRGGRGYHNNNINHHGLGGQGGGASGASS